MVYIVKNNILNLTLFLLTINKSNDESIIMMGKNYKIIFQL